MSKIAYEPTMIDACSEKSVAHTEVRRIKNNNGEIKENDLESSSVENIGPLDMVQVEGDDKILARKMYYVNNAIDEIGFTNHHWKLFCIAGYGYSADSQLLMIQGAVKTYVDLQFGFDFPVATVIFYIGLAAGAAFWGLGADIIGRKIAFNMSLFTAALLGFATGGMSSYATYSIFLFLNSFSAGGNIAMDATVFLEYLPFKYQWLTTFLAAWWGVGQTIAVLVSWAFIPKYSCDLNSSHCESRDNHGWRYCWYVNSGIVMFGALMRLFVFKLDETPKYLISNGRDFEAVQSLKRIAEKYGRTCSLTVEELVACGEIKNIEDKNSYTWKAILKETKAHIQLLVSTKRVAWSTFLVILSWFVIGLAYDTFYNFLYIYIDSHGGNTTSSTFITYRNSSISNFVGIFGPMLAAGLLFVPRLGRRGTMGLGAISTMAILFGYTTVRTQKGDVGFASATYFFINIYYSCLYAYTPEILPSQARATGSCFAVFACRIGGALTPVVYYFGQKSGSSVPIWVCGACIGFLGFIAMIMPFEPAKNRSV